MIKETLLDQINLNTDKVYGCFWEEPHFKFNLVPLRVIHPPPSDSSQPIELSPLVVMYQDDAWLLSIVVSSSDDGPKKSSTIGDYLDPRDPWHVSQHGDVLQLFLHDHGWE